MKPAKFDNSWMGVMGETMATLFDNNNRVIGHCLDTPNCIAYAISVHTSIARVTGILGERDLECLKGYGAYSESEKQYFDKYIKLFNS